MTLCPPHQKSINVQTLDQVNTNSKRPIVTRVCRESRKIALDLTRTDFIGVRAPWALTSFPFRQRHWSKAIIFLVPFLMLDETLDLGYKEHAEFLSWLRDIVTVARHGNIELCLQWDPMEDWDFDDGLNVPETAAEASFMAQFVHITSQTNISLVVKAFTIHVSQSRATSSGLFGRLGEEACQLVDVSDVKSIRKYYNLWYSTLPRGHKKRSIEQKFWNPILKRAESVEDTGNIITRWQHHMLAALWLTEPNAPRDAFPFWDSPSISLEPDFYPRMQPQTDHPWIKKTIHLLPALRSTVCFRFCANKCCSRAKDESAELREWKIIEKSKGVLRGRRRWRFQGRGRWRWRSWAKGKWVEKRCNAPRLLNQTMLKKADWQRYGAFKPGHGLPKSPSVGWSSETSDFPTSLDLPYDDDNSWMWESYGEYTESDKDGNII